MRTGLLLVLAVRHSLAQPAAPEAARRKTTSRSRGTRGNSQSRSRRGPNLPEPPKSKYETLQFNVNWPSGLSLGEGQLTSSQTPQAGPSP